MKMMRLAISALVLDLLFISPRLQAEFVTQSKGNVAKPATLNRELACVRHMFNLAIRDGKAEKNLLNGVSLEKENSKWDRVLTEEEYRNLL